MILGSQLLLWFQGLISLFPPVDIIWAMVIVWRIRGKIVRTVLCCVVYDSCAQWYVHTHTYEQFLKMSVGLGLDLVFVHFFWFSILCVFWFSLDCFVIVLSAFVVLGLVSSPPPSHHNHFTALFPGPPGWAGARRGLLDFMVQGKINRGRHTDHPSGRHSIRTNQCPPPSSPHIFYGPDALPAAQPTVS